MSWVVVQLTAWAKQKLSTKDLERSFRKKLQVSEITLFYPVQEDMFGKKESPYSEYVFVTSPEEGVDYQRLESLDEVVCLLTTPSGDLHTVTDDDIFRIRSQVSEIAHLRKNDVVKILEGTLQNQYGVVKQVFETEALLEVSLGSEKVDASIPINQLRKSKKRTLSYKETLKKKRSLLRSLDIMKRSVLDVSFGKVNLKEQQAPPSFKFSEGSKITVVRRGPKNSRVVINGEIELMENEKVEKLLANLQENSN